MLKELYNVFYEGYMAGVGDSEDYDHDPNEMVELAWAYYLAETFPNHLEWENK